MQRFVNRTNWSFVDKVINVTARGGTVSTRVREVGEMECVISRVMQVAFSEFSSNMMLLP